MKLLTFVDIHGNKKRISEIIKKSKNADLLVCAGDISTWASKLKSLINNFKPTKKPLLIIHGNHEYEEEIKEACKNKPHVIPIHLKAFILNNYFIFGYGGGGFSEYDQKLEKLIPKIKKQAKSKKVIFVTHAPPYNTKIDLLQGLGHRGSKSIRKFIKEVKPILHICGHFHETAEKKDKLGKTTIINPGPKGKLIKI